MGGTNDPSNIELVTIKEHAQRHKDLYLLHNKLEDKIAYLCLSGKTNESEKYRKILAKEKHKEFLEDPIRKFLWIEKIKEKRKNQIFSKESNAKRGLSLKKAYKEGRKKYVKPSIPTKISNSTKEKMSLGRKNSNKWTYSVTNKEYKDKKSAIHKEAIKKYNLFNEEHCNNISKAKKGKNYNSKKVSVYGITYGHCSLASEAIGIPVWTIRRRATSCKHKDVFYI